MSEIYNAVTITAELLLIAVVIYQRYTIAKLKKNVKDLENLHRQAKDIIWMLYKEVKWLSRRIREIENAESDTDTNGSADGSVVCVHNDDSETE